MKRLGPIPSSWQIPAPRVRLRTMRRGLKLRGKQFQERETSGSQFALLQALAALNSRCCKHSRLPRHPAFFVPDAASSDNTELWKPLVAPR